ATIKAMKCGGAVTPFLRQRRPVTAMNLIAGTAGIIGAYFESGGVDQTIERVFAPPDNNTGRRDALNSPTLGVDERDVRAVEGLQVFVMEARPLAELTIVRLERCGG